MAYQIKLCSAIAPFNKTGTRDIEKFLILRTHLQVHVNGNWKSSQAAIFFPKKIALRNPVMR